MEVLAGASVASKGMDAVDSLLGKDSKSKSGRPGGKVRCFYVGMVMRYVC
jgi:hypothetical protein